MGKPLAIIVRKSETTTLKRHLPQTASSTLIIRCFALANAVDCSRMQKWLDSTKQGFLLKTR